MAKLAVKSMKTILAIPALLLFLGCQARETAANPTTAMDLQGQQPGTETATFAGGCFWCTEAVFLELDGVRSVVSGYTGGKTINPSYKEICNGDTGHAEAIRITYEPSRVTYGELLEIFFATHDPTTLNRQGNDVGTQYRSEIFYHSEKQRQQAEDYIAQLEREGTFGKKIVTKLSAAPIFYPAEDYHQNYYARNQEQSYCSYVITPKVEKVRTKFSKKLKQ